MIEQAKGIAQSAQSADNTQNTVSVTVTGITSGATVVLAGADITLTAQTTASTSVQFTVGSTQGETATNLAALINATTYAATYSYSAAVNGETLTVTKYTRSINRETDAVATDVNVSAGASSGVVTAGESELESLIAQYNTLRSQLTELAEDSGYKGKNLLSTTSTLRSMTVKFEGTTLTIHGFNATATGLGITSASATGSTTTTPAPDKTWTNGTMIDLGGGSYEVNVSVSSPGWEAADMNDLVANPQNYRVVTPTALLIHNGSAWVIATGTTSDGQAATIEKYAGGVNPTTGLPNSTTTTSSSGGWFDPAAIDTSLNELDAALITLRKESSKMSANLGIITTRQDFSTEMMNTLSAGADKLTLADTNEEGATMLMLQTRESLSITALTMSAQASQSVLRLFG